ncbi:uncharacterized protein [Watersipora subatra]|uniref:uncharacterized protein n=1 Tax=Watersipora subatra TaxID=2589382 RepID=UPI00355C64F8
MNKICHHCQALKWKDEAPGMCCANGKVKIPVITAPPEPLRSLMTGVNAYSRHFLSNIRKYNNCFQMTSFGASREIREQGFMPTVKAQGPIYHLHGLLVPAENENNKFLQIFFMGNSDDEVNQRCENVSGFKRSIVHDLQNFFHRYNYVQEFKTSMENLTDDSLKILICADRLPAGEHEQKYNAAKLDEPVIVIVGQDFDKRDILLHKRQSGLTRVSETHISYDALQYPIIYWQGQDGYHLTIKQVDPNTGNEAQRKTVSAMDSYAFRIMIRNTGSNHLLRCRHLLHQFLTDMYAKIESERLAYIRHNQRRLRADSYIHLHVRDAMINDDAQNTGQLVILPSSFTGSPRYMHEYVQDAMTYVRQNGRPDLFITLTFNPKWTDIKEALLDGQAAHDRHDIVARVLGLKVKLLLNLLT